MPFLSDEIVALYCNKRLSCAAIAERDSRSESTIYNILRRKGIRCRSRSQANKIFSDRLLIKLYNLGLSCSQIGRLLGIHPSTIIKRFNTCKFMMRKRNIANAIRYTEEEFQKHFYNKVLIDHIKIFMRTNRRYHG